MFFSGKQFGNYTLVKLLGQGSFGEVWLANRQTKFVTTKVAVKLPLRGQVDAESIKQEAILWEQASGHPNVLPIIEADEYDGQIVIISEYASGGTLEDLLRREGFLPTKKAIEMAIGILNGLEFLHSRQIIHRDIKPANILLQGDIPRLTDFGLSRAISGNSLSMSISINGTPYYMSPEAFNRKRNKQTDIWSFGVVLYKMLTGKLPFEGNDVAELYTAVFNRQPAPFPSFIPPLLQQIVLKALAKSPAERYANAMELREDLMLCLASLSAENIQIHQTSADKIKIHQTGEPQQNQSDESLFISTQPNLKAKLTDRQNSLATTPVLAKPPRKILSLKYLAAACVLLISIFATGFYFISKRVPIPFRQGDKFGYSTWSKKVIIGAKYDIAEQFIEKRALVGIGKKDEAGNFKGKYGFIDHVGREIIQLEYDNAESFSESLAKVGRFDEKGEKKKFGFIDRNGLEIIPLIYDDAQSFSENFASVKSGDKWGVIDPKGNQIIPFKYEWIDRFSGGLAVVKSENKYGFIDTSGNLVVAPVYDLAEKFSDDLAPVQKDGKAFFIDAKGQQILPYKYETANNFSEGFAMVKRNGKSGFIDKNGAEWINFQYENEKSDFSEGLAAVKLNGKYGFIDNGGKLVIPFKYAEAKPLKNHLAFVKSDDGKEFYISYDGTEFYQP